MAVAERIVSLLPSATEIVCALGLAHHLVGVSHSCDHPPLIRSKPRLTRARFPLDGLSSGEMDAAVRQALREFGSVYEVDNERLAAVAPALALVACPTVLALDAHDITGVLATIRLVGHAGGVPERAERCVRDIERRIAAVRARVEGRPVARVLALEWLDPPFVPGHWVPEMVALAGGTLLRGVSGRPSFAVQWAELVGLDPDVLLVMPCGFELAAARADADACRAPLGAVAPRAIRSGRAYAVDATAHFSRPGPRVADGVELLGALFHPDTFPGAPLEGRATVWA